MAGAVYWVGADGNVYYKGSQGVQNYGSASNYQETSQGLTTSGVNTAGNKMAQGVSDGAGVLLGTKIADPNAPAAPSGGSATNSNDDAAIANTSGSISQIAPLLAAALASEGTSYGNATNALDASKTAQQATYDQSTDTNQNNYDSNFMQSILSGVKGLASLKSLLRGSGAAGGTAEDQVQDVVGGQTANDIQTGADTQKGNQTTLDNALSSFLTDLKSKKAEADDTHANNVSAINAQSATNLQDLYSKMAGYYSDEGKTAQANTALGQAGALTPQIAANSKTQTSAYDTTPVAVQAPQLTAFAAPTQPNSIVAPSNGQVGSGIFTLSKPKKDDTTVATTPAAASAAGA